MTQLPNTTACYPILEFLQNGHPYAYQAWSGCYTTPPNQEVILGGNVNVGSGVNMDDDQLCNFGSPAPPFSGEPCIKVGT